MDIVGKAFFKSILGETFIGRTALEIHNEYEAKQIKRKIGRLDEFYHSLDERFLSLENQVNEEFLKREDFQDVFEEATRYVVSERQKIKRDSFKNILVNSIISNDCDYDKTERYFRILDNLSNLDLHVLAVLDNPDRYNKSHGMIIKPPINNAYQSSWSTVTTGGVLTQMLGIKIHELRESISILFSNGLVVERFLERSLQTNANTVHVLDNMLTIRGRDFVKYLKG